MTKKERKVILTGVGIILAILLIVVIVRGFNKKGENVNMAEGNTQTEQNVEKYVTNLDDGTKLNNSGEFNKTKKYKDIEISNIQFTYQAGNSVLLADLKNTGSTKHNSEIVKVTILDENNKVIDELQPILPTMEAGETKQLNITISGADSVNAKNFKIEEK